MTAAAIAAAVVTPPAQAQTPPTLIHAEDNEAVTVDSFGNKRYLMPPMPLNADNRPQRTVPSSPSPFVNIAFMHETKDGLVECSNRFRDVCRPTTYPTGKPLIRTWIVLRRGLWLECHGPSRNDFCIASVAFNGSKGDQSKENRWKTPPTR